MSICARTCPTVWTYESQKYGFVLKAQQRPRSVFCQLSYVSDDRMMCFGSEMRECCREIQFGTINELPSPVIRNLPNPRGGDLGVARQLEVVIQEGAGCYAPISALQRSNRQQQIVTVAALIGGVPAEAKLHCCGASVSRFGFGFVQLSLFPVGVIPCGWVWFRAPCVASWHGEGLGNGRRPTIHISFDVPCYISIRIHLSI